MNIGHGFDIHRLEVGIQLVIGGVDIPWTHGLSGYSDDTVGVYSAYQNVSRDRIIRLRYV